MLNYLRTNQELHLIQEESNDHDDLQFSNAAHIWEIQISFKPIHKTVSKFACWI